MSVRVISPMLATAAPRSHLDRYVADDGWALEQKVDGRRMMLSITETEFTVLNRSGKPTVVPVALGMAWANAVRKFEVPGFAVVDGEWADGTFWAFDLVAFGSVVSNETPWDERRAALVTLLDAWEPGPVIRLLPVARTREEKEALVRRVMAEGGEGFVAKRVDAGYRFGTTTRGSSVKLYRSTQWVKIKLTNDVDCIVTALGADGKQNMTLSLYHDGDIVDVGECTRLAGDGARVKVGDVVTVKVLYATESDRLYQPTLPRIRTDKTPAQCTLDQLDAIRVNKTVVSGADIWTDEHRLAAAAEGWDLFECSGSESGPLQVQAFDEPGDDQPDITETEAWALVRAGATPHAKVALALLREHNPLEYVRVMSSPVVVDGWWDYDTETVVWGKEKRS